MKTLRDPNLVAQKANVRKLNSPSPIFEPNSRGFKHRGLNILYHCQFFKTKFVPSGVSIMQTALCTQTDSVYAFSNRSCYLI